MRQALRDVASKVMEQCPKASAAIIEFRSRASACFLMLNIPRQKFHHRYPGRLLAVLLGALALTVQTAPVVADPAGQAGARAQSRAGGASPGGLGGGAADAGQGAGYGGGPVSGGERGSPRGFGAAGAGGVPQGLGGGPSYRGLDGGGVGFGYWGGRRGSDDGGGGDDGGGDDGGGDDGGGDDGSGGDPAITDNSGVSGSSGGGVTDTAPSLVMPSESGCDGFSKDDEPFSESNLERLNHVYRYLRRATPQQAVLNDYLIATLALYQHEVVNATARPEQVGVYLASVADIPLTAAEVARVHDALCVSVSPERIDAITAAAVMQRRKQLEKKSRNP